MTAEQDCRAAWAAQPEATWAWHLHHEVLAEPLTEPAANRIDYIVKHKPPEEQETRLRLFRPIMGALPEPLVKAWAAADEAWAASGKASAAYVKAWAAADEAWAASGKASAVYDKARAVYDKAWAAYGKAKAVYDKAWAVYGPAIEALHAIEHPDCPWDGRTIFPEVKR